MLVTQLEIKLSHGDMDIKLKISLSNFSIWNNCWTYRNRPEEKLDL